MKNLSLALIPLIALTVAPVLAQPSHAQGRGGMHGAGGGPRFLHHVVRQLDLSDEQRDEWQQIVAALHESVQPLLEEARALHQELRDLTESTNPDPTAAGQLYLDAAAIHNDVRASHENAQTDLRAILTAEQLAVWDELEEEAPMRGRGRRDHRGGHGRHQ